MDADFIPSFPYDRTLGRALREAMLDTPVVCLLGPRQCGKTTLAMSLEKDRGYISLDEDGYFRAATEDPDGFVARLPARVTLDEVQRVPALLTAIKRAVDRDRRPGRFLLTGSANLLLLPGVSESLAGRMEVIPLQPLTESEKDRNAGDFLRQFLDGSLRSSSMVGEGVDLSADLPVRMVAGGYPEPLTRSPARARQWHRQYLKSIIDRDVQDIAQVKDGREVGRLFEMLALRTGSLLNVTSLSKELGLHRGTVDHYLAILERLFLIRSLQSWHRHPAKRLIKTPKIHLVDSGLAATLSDLSAGDWLGRRDSMGHLLETFVVQQIIAQAAWTDQDLRFWHYRDKDQVEVDLVVTRGEKVWGIEVKASRSVNAKDGRGLNRLADQCGKDFQGGCVLYDGWDVLPIGGSNHPAVPLRKLWEM
ncbi:MAG: ATP-binding protein [Luteolibacter sp.]